MESISIAVENVTVTYHDRVALYHASLQIRSGIICGLVGMNGAGKSTLFKAIMGFVQPVQGRVLVQGLPVRQAQKRHLIAYVPQAEEVDWQFPVTVFDVVMMGRYGYMPWLRIPSRIDYELVKSALLQVEMWELRERPIGELSGGQRKRVFLGRALAQQAQIFLLDEPFAGVDITTERLIIDRLLQLRAQGHTILISTHDLTSIKTFCDQVVLINRSILAYGDTETVFTPENLCRTFGNHFCQRSQGE
ncbi:MAG: metal ABC transporter ATP-binding protein [Pseudanabaenaceae cyanobacterium SKYGB_i_bin29]|nr:metal ABC transporter ATP-binding protein [Pseudanabaenaceae cyanobacterium SKYG29]MDW8421879.1 metal ABC transporter ATP-binding protein [Pseudanabaenaceae cyanobacterium SKYGB_i_bin29]